MPINADTHRALYLPNGKVYELQTWYTDGGWRPHQPQMHDLKGQGRKVTWSVWAILAQCVISGRRGIPVGRTRRSHFLFLCVLHCHDYCFSKLLYLTQQMLLMMMMMMMMMNR